MLTARSPWLGLSDVLAVAGGELRGAAPAGSVAFGACAIDSRALEGGELFVPLPGTRADGHQFIAAALAAGAAGSLVAAARPLEPAWLAAGAPLIAVADPLEALQALGRHCRDRAGIPAVAVTGSNGKTTTKEMIAAVVGTGRRVHRNHGNWNNHIGVPLTLTRLRPEHQVLVVELGMSARGEIRALAALARPDVGVLTNAAAAHLEQLKTVEEVALAKSELAESLPANGLLIVNADDARLWAMNRARPVRTLGYALENAEAALRPERVRLTARGGSQFTLPDGTEVTLALLGRHNARNALAAILAGDHFGVPRAAAAAALAALRPQRHRLERIESRGVVILDDAYNANPASMAEALRLLASIEVEGERRAVLADMLELGPGSAGLHEEIGRLVPGGAWLYAVGAFARDLARGARAAGVPPSRIRCFDDVPSMAQAIRADAKAGDLILVKGSRGMRLEQVVESLAPGSAPAEEPARAGGRR